MVTKERLKEFGWALFEEGGAWKVKALYFGGVLLVGIGLFGIHFLLTYG